MNEPLTATREQAELVPWLSCLIALAAGALAMEILFGIRA